MTSGRCSDTIRHSEQFGFFANVARLTEQITVWVLVGGILREQFRLFGHLAGLTEQITVRVFVIFGGGFGSGQRGYLINNVFHFVGQRRRGSRMFDFEMSLHIVNTVELVIVVAHLARVHILSDSEQAAASGFTLMTAYRVFAREHQFATFTYKTDVHFFVGARQRNLLTV